jgi:hypothetical protein
MLLDALGSRFVLKNPAMEKEDRMSWRIAEAVVRGEIDNRLPGIIKGSLYLDGLNTPVRLELEGNCDPDLAGRHLTFRNLMPRASTSLDGFAPVQCGEVGMMTASSMVRIPTIPSDEVTRRIQEHKPIPTCWSESLYLEWFSDNGRVLIEGSSFACQLSAAKWKICDETHEWIVRLRERCGENFLCSDDDPFDEEKEGGSELVDEPFEAGRLEFKAATVDGYRPHPLVQHASEFLLRLIFETKVKRYYVDDAIQNQPLESMIESTTEATVRLAHALAELPELGSGQLVHRLKRAHWALTQASENAGLARHVCAAEAGWLEEIRREFGVMRRDVRRLIHEYQEEKPGTGTASAK